MTADNSPSVVVINDSLHLLRLFEAILSAHGMSVATFPYDADPVALILNCCPHLVILGLTPYDLDGVLEVVQAMRRDPRTVHIPIILCRSMALTEPMADIIRETDALSILDVPFTYEELLTVTHAALSLPASQGC